MFPLLSRPAEALLSAIDDTPTFDRDHSPPGDWTPWTATGAEAWRRLGCMAGARIRVEFFAATGYSLRTEYGGRSRILPEDHREVPQRRTFTITDWPPGGTGVPRELRNGFGAGRTPG